MEEGLNASMKKQSLSKNYILQFLYQGLMLVIPFILSPYLTRTLQETALGTYGYVHSIAYYFVIAANLGIEIHGKRLVSQNSHDPKKLRRGFWSLYTVHAIFSLLAILVYLVFAAAFGEGSKIIYLIETLYVVSALFDITWLFYGLENFSSVVIKNAVVKLAECLSIFLLVKSPQDLWKYTLITASGILVGQLVMLPQAVKLVRPIRFTQEDAREHIKPLFLFSVSIIAISLYTVFDKTLLGVLTTKENVAFYEYSDKIINIPKSFVRIIGTVMLPRACRLVSLGRQAEQKKYIEYAFIGTAFISMASIFGLLGIADQFAILFYGENFSACGSIIKALSPLTYIIGMGSVLRSQVMIPHGLDKQFNLCIVFNAIINLVLSLLLIPVLGIYGAVAGTLAAELFGLCYQLVLCRKYIDYKVLTRSTAPFVIIGAVMLLAIRSTTSNITANVTSLMLQVLIGAVVYSVLSMVYAFVFHRPICVSLLEKVKEKLRKGRN